MAGLYDKYQLTNSSQIPIYEGSANKEVLQVAEVLQGRYDQAQAYDDYLAEQAKYAKVHDKDRGLFTEMTQGYRDRLTQRAQSGNYEDMLRATAQDARGFGRDYAAFADNLKRRQDYREDIEKQRKDLNLSADDVNGLLALSEYQTKGLRKDPKTGEIVGQFQGITPNKSIDFSAWTDEKLKGIIAQENGWDSTSVQGISGMSDDGEKYYVQRGGKTVTVDAKRIRAVLNQAMQLDPEFQGALKQKAMLGTIGLDRMTPAMVKDAAVRDRIQAAADGAGISFGQAYQQMAGSDIVNNITKGSLNYGVLKREQHDVDSSMNIRGETEQTGRDKKVLEDNIRFMIPDGDGRFDEKMKDPGLLQDASNSAQSTITSMTARLSDPKLTPEDRRDVISQIQAAKASKTSADAILNGARNAVATKLGYSQGYDAMMSSQLKPVMDATAVPVTGKTADGRDLTMSKAEVVSAILGNKVKRMNRSFSNPYGSTGNDNYEVQTSKGTITVSGGELDKLVAPMQKVTQLRNKIDSDVNKEVKQNAEKYAYKPTQVSLSKAEAEGLEKLYQGSPGAFDIRASDNQSAQILDADDLPKDLRFSSTHITKADGSVVLKGQEYDEKGKPTGKVFYAKPLPGNNINVVIGKNLLKKTQDRDMMMAGASLINNNWSGTVASLQDNEELPITVSDGDMGTNIGFVKRIPSTIIAGKSRYIITDANKNRIASFDDINEASMSIQSVVDKQMSKNLQKK